MGRHIGKYSKRLNTQASAIELYAKRFGSDEDNNNILKYRTHNFVFKYWMPKNQSSGGQVDIEEKENRFYLSILRGGRGPWVYLDMGKKSVYKPQREMWTKPRIQKFRLETDQAKEIAYNLSVFAINELEMHIRRYVNSQG